MDAKTAWIQVAQVNILPDGGSGPGPPPGFPYSNIPSAGPGRLPLAFEVSGFGNDVVVAVSEGLAQRLDDCLRGLVLEFIESCELLIEAVLAGHNSQIRPTYPRAHGEHG